MAYKNPEDRRAYYRRWAARPDVRVRRRLQQKIRRARPAFSAAERNVTLQRRYGITQADYSALLTSQDGRCAICGAAPHKQSDWHVDHDHETGKVRGVLCRHCNRALGAVKDSIYVLRRAVDYLRKHGGNKK